jgi:hypothetical protein
MIPPGQSFDDFIRWLRVYALFAPQPVCCSIALAARLCVIYLCVMFGGLQQQKLLKWCDPISYIW